MSADWNLKGIENLSAGIIEQAYYDLLNSYKKILAIKYKDHSENTKEKYRHVLRRIKYTHKNTFDYLSEDDFENEVVLELNKAIDEKNGCIQFFESDYFLFLTKNAVAEFFIENAKKEAVKWFRDKDIIRLQKNEKIQKHYIKNSLKKRKIKKGTKNETGIKRSIAEH